MKTKKSDLIRVFIKGGILAPGNMLKIMGISSALGNKYVMFGSRQDVLFPAFDKSTEEIKELFSNLPIDYEIGSDQSVYQNIVSSYAAVNIIETTNWVKEDTYHYIINNFDYLPQLKINIVDPVQSLVPLFTGELNFIASKEDNYWYLYIRDPRKGNQLECWPRLIFSQDITKVAIALEELFLKYNPYTISELFLILRNQMRVNYREISEPLKFPVNSFPKYEGLNGGFNNQFWLGLYWRNNQFAIDFMSAACRLCQDTNIGKINVIPWKALLIKGIKANERIRWEKVMGKFGVNDRHSALELNWHLPVLDKNALELKQYLVRELDQLDISTHGLTFTIRTKRNMYLFTSIVIEENEKLGGGYDVLYAKNFDPNNTTYITYASDVKKEMLPALLIELSKMYFRQLVPEKQATNNTEQEPTKATKKINQSYQCSNCLSVFDKRYGDSLAGISAGTPFEELPAGYTCPVCGGPKSDYGLIEN